MENDIPSIHDIISNCNIEGSLDELNEKLADQLEGILSQRCTSTQNEDQIAINPENISCFKCNKNCRTRGTYCTTGKHWIHYRCQKLTEIEIKKVDKTRPKEEDTCKLCYDPKSNKLAIAEKYSLSR